MDQKRSIQFYLLLAPGAAWLLLFFALPLLIVLLYSFFTRGPYGNVVYDFTLDNYARLANPIYLQILIRSLWMAVTAMLISLLLGYPLAWFIVRQPSRWRPLLLLLVIIPFWTNFLVRTYAIIVLLRTEGVINGLLQSWGVIEAPLDLLYNSGAVTLGLVYGYLPFMVLPIYASLEKLDPSLMEAAQDLGANAWRSFWRVMLPLTMPGVAAGSILVFIPAIGAFITPDLLGGAKVMMIGNLIDQQFLSARNWPFGAAVSIVLMLIVSAATVAYFRLAPEAER
ncbi:MAG: ABC transporter permease [Caldilineaceae bacterium]|nr:ABC transporter permease [Caldilineaceae bacterium]MCB0145409.1 ABC transporter permease [Caldilineaceae bacterium]